MQNCFQTTSELILASGSPRRRDFLDGLGLDFQVRVADVDESLQSGEDPESFVLRLAEEKARGVAQHHPAAWVVAADTVVDIDGEILGKPQDPVDALAMLKRLIGNWHEVWTGFCVGRGQDNLCGKQAVCTKVRFNSFNDEVLRAYVATGEPLDKAGSYGIQSTGSFLVAEIKGSYSNVVGLPMAELTNELLRLGVIAPASL